MEVTLKSHSSLSFLLPFDWLRFQDLNLNEFLPRSVV